MISTVFVHPTRISSYDDLGLGRDPSSCKSIDLILVIPEHARVSSVNGIDKMAAFHSFVQDAQDVFRSLIIVDRYRVEDLGEGDWDNDGWLNTGTSDIWDTATGRDNDTGGW
jgi:hypothetical protein